MPDYIIQIFYFIGTFLFIIGLKKMSSPTKAKGGLAWAGVGLLISILITYFHHQVSNHYLLITVAILAGGVIAFILAKKAAITEMSQMMALFNGMGAGAAAAIAAVELTKLEPMTDTVKYLVVLGALLGSVSFSGSLIVFARLKGTLKSSNRFPMHQWVNALILVLALTFGLAIILNGNQFEITSLLLFFILSLLFGVLMVLPIANNHLSVLVSLLNIFTGLAVGFVGYALSNPAMMIAGMLVAAASLVLTQKMSKSINCPISKILFGSEDDVDNNAGSDSISNPDKIIKELESNDAAMMMAFAKNVIIIPGYGMAVSQAQHKLWDMNKLLQNNGVNIKYAIHPVAGRMPGHMNVLLAEAGISYDSIFDLDEINEEFERADVVLIIGANDIINPSARADQSSPIFGMPILNADGAKNVIVVKRSDGTGFSNIDNPLFYQDNTSLIYGDADLVLNDIVKNLKAI